MPESTTWKYDTYPGYVRLIFVHCGLVGAINTMLSINKYRVLVSHLKVGTTTVLDVKINV